MAKTKMLASWNVLNIFENKNQREESDKMKVNNFVKSHKRDLLDALA